MTISEKVAYLQGLYDGLGLDGEKSAEARILSEVLDVLGQIGAQLDGMDASTGRLSDELDDLRDSVAELENAVFDEDGGEDFFEIPCPTCGEDLTVDGEAMVAGVVECPKCGGRFAISVEDKEEPMKFICPECGEPMEPDGAELGGVAFCPSCGKNVVPLSLEDEDGQDE